MKVIEKFMTMTKEEQIDDYRKLIRKNGGAMGIDEVFDYLNSVVCLKEGEQTLTDSNKLIEMMIAEELETANKKFPEFASTHEGWAVLLEEICEITNEIEKMNDRIATMWNHVKHHKQIGLDPIDQERHSAYECADHIRTAAVRAIEEAIQVAAMCDKFKALGEKKDGEDHAAQVSEYAEMVLKSTKDFNLVHDQYISPGLGNSGGPVYYGGGSTISKDTKDFLEKPKLTVETITIHKETPSGDPLKMMDTLAEKGAISQEELESFNKNNLSKKMKNRCIDCKWFLAEIFCGKHTKRVDADWTCGFWEGREQCVK